MVYNHTIPYFQLIKPIGRIDLFTHNLICTLYVIYINAFEIENKNILLSIDNKYTFPFSIVPGNLQYTSSHLGVVFVQFPYLHSVVSAPLSLYPSLHWYRPIPPCLVSGTWNNVLKIFWEKKIKQTYSI